MPLTRSPESSAEAIRLTSVADNSVVDVGGQTLRWSQRGPLVELLGRVRRRSINISEALCARLDMLAWHCIQARRRGAAPSGAARAAHMQVLANNLPLRAAMSDAGAALASAGVRAIVYKGQDYLERVYGDVGAREMADVDLLVEASAWERAATALQQAGFMADPIAAPSTSASSVGTAWPSTCICSCCSPAACR